MSPASNELRMRQVIAQNNADLIRELVEQSYQGSWATFLDEIASNSNTSFCWMVMNNRYVSFATCASEHFRAKDHPLNETRGSSALSLQRALKLLAEKIDRSIGDEDLIALCINEAFFSYFDSLNSAAAERSYRSFRFDCYQSIQDIVSRAYANSKDQKQHDELDDWLPHVEHNQKKASLEYLPKDQDTLKS